MKENNWIRLSCSFMENEFLLVDYLKRMIQDNCLYTGEYLCSDISPTQHNINVLKDTLYLLLEESLWEVVNLVTLNLFKICRTRAAF